MYKALRANLVGHKEPRALPVPKAPKARPVLVMGRVVPRDLRVRLVRPALRVPRATKVPKEIRVGPVLRELPGQGPKDLKDLKGHKGRPGVGRAMVPRAHKGLPVLRARRAPKVRKAP